MLVTKSSSRGVLKPDSSRSCRTRGVKHGTDNCDRYNWTRHGQLLTKVWQEQCCLFVFLFVFVPDGWHRCPNTVLRCPINTVPVAAPVFKQLAVVNHTVPAAVPVDLQLSTCNLCCRLSSRTWGSVNRTVAGSGRPIPRWPGRRWGQ